jgi:hypothetical protein
MPSPINPIDHPICLAVPERRVPSHWTEHVPFAMWLTSALRPRVLVELGAFSGTSYCAFCQAIAALELPTRAFAVDTWEGDPHNGPNTREVLDDLKKHHDLRYARFSTLLKMHFDEAVHHFADGEIDLLHIDGYHTYEAVRHDFETWRPKVSDRGIILFHDVVERIADFGVWRLWEELTAQYRSYTFVHEHGLGVLALGPDVPDEVRALLDLRGADIEPVRMVFQQLGRRLRLANDLGVGLAERDIARAERDNYFTERDAARAERDTARAERDAARAEWDAARAERDAARAEWDAARAERDAARAGLEATRNERDTYHAVLEETRIELDRMRLVLRAAEGQLAGVQRAWAEHLSSQSWRAFHQVVLLGQRLGPEGSRRRLALKRFARLIEVLGREGAIGFARRQVRQAIERNSRHREARATIDGQTVDGPAARSVAPAGTPHSNKGNSHARVH